MTSIALDRATAKLGEEIRVRPTAPIRDWSGEATVNSFRNRIPIDSTANVIKVTRENGFTTLSPSEICVSLKDVRGRAVRVNRSCVHLAVSSPLFDVQPLGETLNANGGSGRIQIKAPSTDPWIPLGAPDWVTLTRDPADGVESAIHYQVGMNRSRQPRSASIAIGDSRFELTQWGSPYIDVPYTADFSQPPIAVWELQDTDLKTGHSNGEPPRWVLDDQPGQGATVQSESSDAPGGGSAYVVERLLPSFELWKTQLWMPGIRLQEGALYTAAVWLKSESPTTIGVEIAPREEAFRRCGLLEQVKTTAEWKEFKFHFRAEGETCGAETNRLAIQCGRVAGKLWIAGFSLTKP